MTLGLEVFSGFLVTRATRLRNLIVASVVLLTPSIGLGQDAGIPNKVTTVEGITEYALDNGLQVLLFPDPSKATVTVNVTYRVGSRHEGRGETGMAHLLEHMVFKGTPTYKNIWGSLEEHGASFNGSTWVDRTNYFETLPANDVNLDFALHMESDRMINSNISGEDLAKEMTVVRNEFEMGENDPVGVLSERMLSAAYLWHNYGKSTIGNRSDIERVPVEYLRRFYKKYYQPDNATLVVAGKFDSGKTLGLIKQYFGAIPRPKRVLEKTYTEEPTQDGARLVRLERVGDVAAAGLVYHIPAGAHPDFAAVQILQGVLTDQPSGRLYKALVETGKAASVRGSAFSWAEPGVMQFMAQVRLDQDAQAVLDEMTSVVEHAATADITEQDVDRIKVQQLKNIRLSLNDSGRIGVRLSEAIAKGDWRLFFLHRDRIKAVTADDVRRVAGVYLVESNRTAGLFVPQREPTRAPIPKTPDIAKVLADYRGGKALSEGEAFVATPKTIENRVKRVDLSSGIKLALLPKETRGDTVNVSFVFRFGYEEALKGNTTAISLIPSMLMRGTTKHDYQQLRDEIDRLQSRISVGGGGGFRGRRGGGGGGGGLGRVSASIESDRANIVAAIELLGEIMRRPAFDVEEFKTVKAQRLARSEQRLSDPRALGANAMSRAINPWPADSIHYVPTLTESIERLRSVSLSQVKDLYARLYGASNLSIAIVGDFDEKRVTKAIESVFGTWKSKTAFTRVAKPYRDYKKERLTINTPDKEMATVGMSAAFEMRDDDPDFAALTFGAYVLGQGGKSRLMTRLRHQGGLSYGAGASFRADSQDRRATVSAIAICAPQNAVKAQDAMREEVVKWVADGVTDKELEEGKSAYALRFANSLSNDRFVLRQLVRGLEIGRTFEYQADLLRRIQTLSVADVRAALAKHLGRAQWVEMKAGDLERKASRSGSAAPSEAQAGSESASASQLPERMRQFDANGDGKLQKSEAPERMQRFFDRMDANGDGVVDGEEISAMRGRRGNGGRRSGPGGGR